MTNGFIKIHRQITKWEWYQDTNTFRLFLHLLIKAQWEDGQYQGINIPRGSLITGRGKLAKELNMSERSVRTALEHLKSTNEVIISSTNKFSVITVTNYGLYQDANDEVANKGPTKRQQNDQQNDQQTTNKTTSKFPFVTVTNCELQQNTGNTTANKTPANDQQNGQQNASKTTTIKEIKKERIIEEKKNIKRKEISLVLPLEFQTTVFGDAWAKWVSYRKNIRHALVQETAEGQIKKLMKMSGGSDAVAAAIIEQSIDHGWQGLFELKENTKKTVSTRDLFSEIDEALHDN